MAKDYYEILGLKKGEILKLGKEEALKKIQSAFRKLSLRYHPDKQKGKSNKEKENAANKFQEISEACEELSKLFEKEGGGPDPDDNKEPCHNEENGCKNNCTNDRTNHYKIGEKNIVIDMYEEKGKWKRKWGWLNNYFFFCSGNCLNQFKNNSLFLCQKCGDVCWVKKVTKNIKSSLSYCPECFESINGTPSGGGNKKVPRPGGGRCPGEYCGGVREATGWKQGGCKKKWYCEFCWGAIFGEEENKNDKNENNNEDYKPKNLQSEIQKAIQEIETELQKEPVITSEELDADSPIGWKEELENVSGLADLNNKKEIILKTIKEKRALKIQQTLESFRQQIIQQIKNELNKEPKLENQELSEPNWEKKINALSEKNQIKSLRDQILADISNKRLVKQQKTLLLALLTQAKQKENWENYSKLENILTQIKKLRASNAYQEKLAEIQTIENRLQELDPSQYEKTKISLLDQQLKDEGLNDRNMDEETKAALKEAKQNPTPENIAKAEEKIHQNGANNNLDNLLTQTLNKLKKGNLTESEKQAAISKIIEFILSENKYQREAYKLKKSKVDALLAELRGEKNNQEGVPLTRVIIITALIVLPLTIVFILIRRARRRRLN